MTTAIVKQRKDKKKRDLESAKGDGNSM